MGVSQALKWYLSRDPPRIFLVFEREYEAQDPRRYYPVIAFVLVMHGFAITLVGLEDVKLRNIPPMVPHHVWDFLISSYVASVPRLLASPELVQPETPTFITHAEYAAHFGEGTYPLRDTTYSSLWSLLHD